MAKKRIFVTEHDTEKVLYYKVMSKFCGVCKKWENCDQDGDEFMKWQEEHKGV